MNQTTPSLLNFLQAKKWIVRLYTQPQEVILPRGDRGLLGDAYIEFLATVEECINQSETCWFNCQNHFQGNIAYAFAWNEWELLGLQNSNSPKEMAEVETFWANYLPFVNAVQPIYASLCLRLRDGAVCVSEEPLFEDTVVISSSFEAFASQLIDGNINETVARLLGV